MFDAISRFFSNPKITPQAPLDTKLAVATLLVHLMDVDGQSSPEERVTVSNVLREHFDLDTNQLGELINAAHDKDNEAVDFFQFTSVLVALEMEQRIQIIGLMWQVVFADGKNHEMEDNMVWRIAELIGVSARERTKLRKTFKQDSQTTNP